MDTSKFRTDHPNYRQYSDTGYATTHVPQGLTGALSGVLLRLIQDQEASLTAVINRLRSYGNDGPTGNWSWNYLVEDLQSALWALANDEKWFPRFMDGVLEAVVLINRAGPHDVVEEVNELLHDHHFGYTVVRRPGGTYGWDLREEQHVLAPDVLELQQKVEDICVQTGAHLEQLRRQLDVGDERSRKDAVRDAVTALETILRQLTGAKDVRSATDALKRHGGWGPDRLLNEGSGIWESVHALYPDVRHGNPTPSTLPHDEATYWIRRIIAFVQYLTERRAAVGGGK